MDKYLNKILQGDCLEAMKGFVPESIDLVITSPPYDNLRDYKGYSFDFEGIAKELYRVIKRGGVIVWVVGDATIDGSETGTSFKQALFFKQIGFNLHDTMIWHKSSPPLTHKRYEQHFEYMFVFSKGPPKTFNPIKSAKLWKDNRTHKVVRREKDGSYDVGFIGQQEDKIIGNVWHMNTGGGHATKDKVAFGHPAIFPEELASNHILSWSNEDDIVLDPMNGSGTTTKMAKFLGRNYIGIEISPEYCKIAEDRLRQEVLL
jgi:site-specific DNA-methyltransferase (adenine-specific)